MKATRKYRAYATGTHCAAIDVDAESPEAAIALARQIRLSDYEVVMVYDGEPIIEEIEEITDDDTTYTLKTGHPEIPFL